MPDLPSRVVIYLLSAAALFAELGYGQVWTRMTSGLVLQAAPRDCAPAVRAHRR